MPAATRKPAVNPIESVLDRILVKRLRPLRADVTAARREFAEQALLRADAELRAGRAEDEAAALRVRVAELEQELAALREARPRWFRRRALVGQPQGS